MRALRETYFEKKSWDGAALPVWAEVRERLPDPVYDAWPAAVAAYWKAWEQAIGAMRSPVPGSGLVSNHMYFDFYNNLFAHDSSIMTMFGRFGHRAFPAIETLDNFYASQHETGEICREIDQFTGEDFWPNVEGDPMTVCLENPWERYRGDWSRVRSYKWTRPTVGTHPPARVRMDGYTDHKFHWAEWLNYKTTGDAARLGRVFRPLEKLYHAFEIYLQDRNGLFITDWAGMDNSPRNLHLGYGVDISSQMVKFGLVLADMAEELNESSKAKTYRDRAEARAEIVRKLMWNPHTGMFHDLRFDGSLVPIKTVMGFAPLHAGIPTTNQLAGMVAQLENPATFKRPVRVPSLAADEASYAPRGEYYLGGVWPFTNAMITEGLEVSGQDRLAGEIGRNYWTAGVDVFEKTGTVWEYFAPEEAAPGRGANPEDPGKNARPDFAGWGAYPVIAGLIEYGIGLRADAPKRALIWNLASTGRCGCLRFAFGDIDTDLVVSSRASAEEEPRFEVMRSNRPFRLVLRWGNGHQKVVEVPGE